MQCWQDIGDKSKTRNAVKLWQRRERVVWCEHKWHWQQEEQMSNYIYKIARVQYWKIIYMYCGYYKYLKPF